MSSYFCGQLDVCKSSECIWETCECDSHFPHTVALTRALAKLLNVGTFH